MIVLVVLALGVWVLSLANPGLAWLVGAALVFYLGHCTRHPRIECLFCRGSGRFKAVWRRRFSLCPVCKGKKGHARLGALIWRRNRYLYRRDPGLSSPESGGMGKV